MKTLTISGEIQNNIANIQYYFDKIKVLLDKEILEIDNYEDVMNMINANKIISEMCNTILLNLGVKDV